MEKNPSVHFRKKSFFITIIFLCNIFCSERIFSQVTISDLLQNINTDSMITTIKELTGNVPVFVEGEQYTISSRIWYTPGKELARRYLQQRLTNLGLSYSIQSFNADSGKNILVTIPGTLYPEKKYIICAHYDDFSPDANLAPGADDNASGVSVVLEAARVLKGISFPHTVIFAFWDQEERGYFGSLYYVNHAWLNGDSILGVINLDMVGYDSNNDSKAQVRAINIGSSVLFANKLMELNNAFNIGLDIVYLNPGYRKSDHAAFWDYGYGAICLIQETDHDRNVNYHKITDLVTHINAPYLTKMAKAAILTFAFFNDVPLPVELSSFTYKIFKSSVQLEWVTQTEINNNRFDIERKILNSAWIKIGEVSGFGNSNSPKFYSFTDKNLLTNGIYYYRLKQIDNDGQFKYSGELEVVRNSTPGVYSLENYPNPFNSSTTIRYALPFDSKVSLIFYNTLGEVMEEFNEFNVAGEYEKVFNASVLSSGIYFYSIQVNSVNGKEQYRAARKTILMK